MPARPFLFSLTAVALLATGPALAQGGTGYVGGNLGYYRFDHEDFPSSSGEFKDERGSWKIVGGARTGGVLGIEGGFVDFGGLEDDDARFESEGVLLAGVFELPVSDDFAPYAKLGQLFWDTESRSPIGRADNDGSDTFYGVGLRLGASPNVDVRLEYERFEIDNADVDMASLGLNFLFN